MNTQEVLKEFQDGYYRFWNAVNWQQYGAVYFNGRNISNCTEIEYADIAMENEYFPWGEHGNVVRYQAAIKAADVGSIIEKVDGQSVDRYTKTSKDTWEYECL